MNSLLKEIIIAVPMVFFFSSIFNFLLGRSVTSITLLCSIVTGVICGFILDRFNRRSDKKREAQMSSHMHLPPSPFPPPPPEKSRPE